jgi:hypothetical protein
VNEGAPRSAVLVEFCGLPAAGKSFLAVRLAAELRRRGRPVTLVLAPVGPNVAWWARIPRKLARATRELIAHPRSSAAAVRSVGLSRQASRRDLVHRSLNVLTVRAAVRRSRQRAGIHVIDQGMVQELCSVAHRGDGRAILDVADPGPARLGPDHLVVVGVPLVVARQRLYRRPGRQSRVERPGGDVRAGLEHFALQLEELLEEWKRRFGHRVPTAVRWVPNAEGSPDAVIRSLADAIDGRG